jgi:hypothetical protein
MLLPFDHLHQRLFPQAYRNSASVYRLDQEGNLKRFKCLRGIIIAERILSIRLRERQQLFSRSYA